MANMISCDSCKTVLPVQQGGVAYEDLNWVLPQRWIKIDEKDACSIACAHALVDGIQRSRDTRQRELDRMKLRRAAEDQRLEEQLAAIAPPAGFKLAR